LYQASSNPHAGALVCIRALFLWHIWLQESIRTVEPQEHAETTPSQIASLFSRKCQPVSKHIDLCFQRTSLP